MLIRWPGRIKPDEASNEIISVTDWLPTLLAAAGQPDIKETLLAGDKVGAETYKVHLDGYNLLPMLTGQGGDWPMEQPSAWCATRQTRQDWSAACSIQRTIRARFRG
jgi:arylsulfatase